ncbi:MAG: DUF5711 family protein [Methanomicrobiales archaeon]|nr:DUF5711 family protein [Methanomicrobiales archaeon]
MDKKGKVLWSKNEEIPVYGVSISPEGSFVAAATDRLKLFFLSGDGIWIRNTGFFVYSVDLSSDAEYIIAGYDDDHVYLFDRDGNYLWDYQTGDSVYGVAISYDGSSIVAGSDDNCVYFFDQNGDLLWSFTTGNDVRSVAISADGKYVVAGSHDRVVYLFNSQGVLLWKYAMGERLNSVSISPDGQYIAACSGPKTKIFNQTGAILWEYDSGVTGKYVGITSHGIRIGPEITTVSLTSSASHLLYGTGGGDQTIYFLSFPEQIRDAPKDSHFVNPLLQSYLHDLNDSSVIMVADCYITSIASAVKEEGNETAIVQIAVPASSLDVSLNRTVEIYMWTDDQQQPAVLPTKYVGKDMQGYLIFEATAPSINGTFAAVPAHLNPPVSPEMNEQVNLNAFVIGIISLIVCFAGIGFWWKTQSRGENKRPIQTDEEELRSVQESLKPLLKK